MKNYQACSVNYLDVFTVSVASASARDMRSGTRVVKPKHKPMTYVEQLQKLNAGTHKPRGMHSHCNEI